jgi:2,4-dienoyl-CoA reductase-like NADH-dependent reductase (Old Yellow Enzyme family)
MVNLFSPLIIGSITLKNRIAVSPMCQYSSEDGFANDWHLVHLGSRAIGGAGLVMTEATAISAEGRISPADLGIWKDEHIPFLQRITQFIIQNNSVPGIQLAHAGRKASHSEPWNGGHSLNASNGGWTTMAPSPIPFSSQDQAPTALTEEGIKKIITAFGEATERALAAGFKIIEIHAAHGYLLHEFLSPLSNHRVDSYGGSFENRCRLLSEVVDAVKSVWPEEFPLFVRISASEWSEGGWTVEDSIFLARLLKDKRIDLIDCSTGGNVAGATIPLQPGFQVPFAEQIRKQTGILTGAVGLITKSDQAETILSEGKADLIFLARELLRDPYFPLRAAHELNGDIQWPKQYERARFEK